jgi:hypothetical protein
LSFIIGFSFIFLLATFTVVLWQVAKRFLKDIVMSAVIFMMMGDAILVGLWYYGLLEVVEVEKHFRLGIAGAFCATAMGRSLYFLMQSEK